MVLSTDLSRHFDDLGALSAALDAPDGLSMDDVGERTLMLSAALKCADIGHPARVWALHRQWTERITEEFFQQVRVRARACPGGRSPPPVLGSRATRRSAAACHRPLCATATRCSWPSRSLGSSTSWCGRSSRWVQAAAAGAALLTRVRAQLFTRLVGDDRYLKNVQANFAHWDAQVQRRKSESHGRGGHSGGGAAAGGSAATAESRDDEEAREDAERDSGARGQEAEGGQRGAAATRASDVALQLPHVREEDDEDEDSVAVSMLGPSVG